MTPNEIKRILFEHEAWLNGSGVRADLRGSKLSGVQYDESTVMLAMACPEKGAFIGYKKAAGLDSVFSDWDSAFTYTVGSVVEEPRYCTDRWVECAPGIHFFMTRGEAVNYD